MTAGRATLMRVALAVLALAFTGPAAVGGQGTAVAPPPAAAALSSSAAGSHLQVYVMTMGQGDYVWEKFGHNAIGIRDLRTGEDLVYNWGMFSFDQAGFLPRFLRGEMQYWMDAADARLTLLAYQRMNRSVTVQELQLAPAQRLALQEFVQWNIRPENTFYRYDYYRDNCSTRVRDALDRVLGGAIRRHAERQPTEMTYRDHSLRLLHDLFWSRTGVDFALGAPTDRRITRLEATFVPMELAAVLRELRVPDEAGNPVPLVAAERVLFEATRPPAKARPDVSVAAFLAAGLVLATLLVAWGYRTQGQAPAITVTVLWGLLAGFLGTLVLLLWVATQHLAAYRNLNLLIANPLWLALALLVPFANAGRGMRQVILLVARSAAVLTGVGAVLALTPWGQPSGAIPAFFVPMNLGVYLLTLRAIYLAQERARRA